jgi:fibronectin type 3 domain-containing protein
MAVFKVDEPITETGTTIGTGTYPTFILTDNSIVTGVSNWSAALLRSDPDNPNGEIEFHISGEKDNSIGGGTNDSRPVINALQIIPALEFLQPNVKADNKPLEYGPLPPGTYSLMHVHGAINVNGRQPKYAGGWYRLTHSTDLQIPVTLRIHYPEINRYTTGQGAAAAYTGRQYTFQHQGGFIELAFDDISGAYTDNVTAAGAVNTGPYLIEGAAYPDSSHTEPVAPIFALIDVAALGKQTVNVNPPIFTPAFQALPYGGSLDIGMFSTTPGSSIYYTITKADDGISEPADPPVPSTTVNGDPNSSGPFLYTGVVHIDKPAKFKALAVRPGSPNSPVTSSYYFYYPPTPPSLLTYDDNTTGDEGGGEGPGSTSGGGTTPPANSPPSGNTVLTAHAGESHVALTWTTVSNATSYVVYRTTVNGGIFSAIGTSNSLSYYDGTVTNGTTYYYVVTAQNAFGEGPRSNQVNAQPALALAPTGLTATPGNAQVSLSWNPVAGALSYTLYRDTTSGGTFTTVVYTGNLTNFTDTGRTNGTTYYYKVSLVNFNGDPSPKSTPAVSATPFVPLSAPTGLTATNPVVNQVHLSWGSVSGATTYAVKRQIGSGSFTTITSSLATTTYDDTSVTLGVTYTYVVTASNTFTTSPDSTPTTITIAVVAPSGLIAVAGDGQVSLSWTASSNGTSYNIKRSTTSGSGYVTVQTGVIAVSYVNTGLTNGTTYYYVVSASASGVESTNSNQASATPHFSSLVPLMTSETSPYGIVSISHGTIIGGEEDWRIFDQNANEAWFLESGGGAPPQWLKYLWPWPVIIKNYTLYSNISSVSPRESWQFQISDDGSTWTTLDTVTLTSPGTNAADGHTPYVSPTLNSSNLTALHARWNITAREGGAGTAAYLPQAIITGTAPTGFFPIMTANNAPSPYSATAVNWAGGFEPYKAMGKKQDFTNYYKTTTSSLPNHLLVLRTGGTTLAPKYCTFQIQSSTPILSMLFQGSTNNGGSWVTYNNTGTIQGSIAAYGGSTWTQVWLPITTNTSTAGNAFQLNVTVSGGGNFLMAIANWQIW